MRLGHHFQSQKMKGQLAGGGGILWRHPAQLVIIVVIIIIIIIIIIIQLQHTISNQLIVDESQAL